MVLFAQVSAFLLLTIFIFLGSLHVYWAMGGKWAVQAAVPEVKGKAAFTPPPLLTLVVAIGLFGFGVLAIVLGLNESTQPWINYLAWGAVGIFGLRAIGDFKYAGFAKLINPRAVLNTRFARNDTRIYSPLCLLIATLFLLIILQTV